MRKPREGEPPVRLNFDVTPKTKLMLEELRRETDAASMSEVVRRALNAYAWIVRAPRDGGRVEIVWADGTREKLRFV